MQHHDALLTGQFAHKDLLAVVDDDIQKTLNQAKKLAAEKIFRHSSKLTTEIAAFGCLGAILDLFIPAIYDHHRGMTLGTKHELALDLLSFDKQNNSSLYEDYMQVLDYICGLTDNTAAKLARDISGIGMI